MKTFGLVCFWLGLVVLIVGVPLAIVLEASFLTSKLLVAGILNLSIGWSLARSGKKKQLQAYCINCGKPIGNENFCTNCGAQIRRLAT